MTLDGFLTVLALAAAIYAVLSPVQRLRVTLTWQPQLLVAVPAFLGILAFELFDRQPPACPAAFGDACGMLILGGADLEPARNFAFLIAFVWLSDSALPIGNVKREEAALRSQWRPS